jgi:tetratricopeptide (TPR) repeat protein
LKTPVAWQAAVAGVGLAALSAVAIRRAATAPFFVVGWFWFLGTLVPVIGMTQRGAQAMSDRYTYMPLTGLFIAAAWGCSRSGWAGRARPVAALAAAALLACALLARSQVGYWHDSVRLLSHATSLSASFSAHKALGGALYDRGRLQEAEAEFRRSLALDPGSWEAHARLGDALYEQRRLAEAAAEYEAALQGAPLNQELHTNLANVRDDLRQTDQALGHYQEALRIDPGFVPALINLGLLYQRRGLLAEAVVNYRKALAVDPLSAEATKRLGAALEAVRASRPPARRDPDPVAQP